MEPKEFIKKYESALATQEWKKVSPLISEEACVSFSDGSVHIGKIKVQAAFQNNFNKIKSEKYCISNVNWIKREDSYAVYTFEYHWSGIINHQVMSGGGIGTSVIIKEDDLWKLLAEHLGKK